MAEEALIGTDAAGNADPRSAGGPLRQRFGSWSQRQDVRRWLAIGLACAAVISGAITYATLSGSAPFGPGPQTILILLNIDLVLLLSLGALVASQLVRLWLERRRGAAGARLHIRMAALFQSGRHDPHHRGRRVLGALSPLRDAVLVQRKSLDRAQPFAGRRPDLCAGAGRQHTHQHASRGPAAQRPSRSSRATSSTHATAP